MCAGNITSGRSCRTWTGRRGENLFDPALLHPLNDNNFGKYVGEPRTFFVQVDRLRYAEAKPGPRYHRLKAKRARGARPSASKWCPCVG
ncbi:hypothetical protein M8494_27525 [Serratia ureilytica]